MWAPSRVKSAARMEAEISIFAMGNFRADYAACEARLQPTFPLSHFPTFESIFYLLLLGRSPDFPDHRQDVADPRGKTRKVLFGQQLGREQIRPHAHAGHAGAEPR